MPAFPRAFHKLCTSLEKVFRAHCPAHSQDLQLSAVFLFEDPCSELLSLVSAFRRERNLWNCFQAWEHHRSGVGTLWQWEDIFHRYSCVICAARPMSLVLPLQIDPVSGMVMNLTDLKEFMQVKPAQLSFCPWEH